MDESLLEELTRSNPKFLGSLQDAEELHRVLDELVLMRNFMELSQSQVASSMGITQSTVSSLESEHSNPNIRTLQRYARALKTRLSIQVVDLEPDFRALMNIRTSTGWLESKRVWKNA
jgi:transcriptional regulator with XRE-family HTH domain